LLCQSSAPYIAGNGMDYSPVGKMAKRESHFMGRSWPI
jgi:hypothetical protein